MFVFRYFAVTSCKGAFLHTVITYIRHRYFSLEGNRKQQVYCRLAYSFGCFSIVNFFAYWPASAVRLSLQAGVMTLLQRLVRFVTERTLSLILKDV